MVLVEGSRYRSGGLWGIFWASCGVWFEVGGLGAEGSDGGKVNKGLFGLAARFRAHTLMQVRKAGSAGWLGGRQARQGSQGSCYASTSH